MRNEVQGKKVSFIKVSREALFADLLILLASVLWGGAYVARRSAALSSLPPLAFNGLRFILGVLVILPLMKILPLKLSKMEIKGGILIGFLLSLATNLQQFGLSSVSAGAAGFISGLYIVIVPLLGLLLKQKVGLGSISGGILAAIGLYLLVNDNGIKFGSGSIIMLICALLFAIYILTVDYFSKNTNTFGLSIITYASCGLLSLIASFFLEPFSSWNFGSNLFSLIYAGVVSVGIAYSLQIFAQKFTLPTHAAIIMSLEAVFAALFGFLFLGESLNPLGIIGAALMFCGFVLAQLKP